jgi:hypothetical protein
VFCTPSFSLTDWFLSVSNLVIPNKCLKNFIYAASSLCSSLHENPTTFLLLPVKEVDRNDFDSNT